MLMLGDMSSDMADLVLTSGMDCDTFASRKLNAKRGNDECRFFILARSIFIALKL